MSNKKWGASRESCGWEASSRIAVVDIEHRKGGVANRGTSGKNAARFLRCFTH